MSTEPPGSQERWDTEVLTDRAAVAALGSEWEELYDEGLEPTPFVAPYWHLAWWDAFAEPEWQMRVVVARRGGRLCAVLPCYLTNQRVLGVSARTLHLWENVYSNRAFPLLRASCAEPALAALVQAIWSDPSMSWSFAELHSTPDDHPATALLRRELETRGARSGFEPAMSSPFRRLPETWDELDGGLGKSFRKTLRRKCNAGKRHGLRVEISTDGRCAPEIFALSEKTWQHEDGTGIGSTPRIRTFYDGVIAGAEARGELQLALLRSEEGAPLAFELNLDDGRAVYNLKVGYDPEAQSLSPGLVLRERVLQEAVESGHEEFDFLGTDEPYKLHWTDTVRVHGRLVVVRGAPAPLLYHWAKFRLRPWLERNAPWVLGLKRRFASASG